MKDFEGRVAVVTGAASGIGAALARHAASLGMRVVLADIDEAGLERTRAEVEAAGARALVVRTDVSDFDQVDALKRAAVDEFGGVHLLFNNAGVLITGLSWERTHQDWEWLLGVNLWGVIHGVRAFVPLLLEQGEPAHIVNTASVAGMTVAPMLGPYTVTKHAVLGLTETLRLELGLLGSPIGVSCLCPGAVDTPIMDADRNRPEELADVQQLNAAERMTDDILRKGIGAGISAADVAAKVFTAIRADQFWILTHPEFETLIRERIERAVSGENPQMVSFPDLELPQ